MSLQNLDIRDENAGKNLTINLVDTPAERGGGDPAKNFCGARVSKSFFTLENPGTKVPVAFDTIERNEKDAATSLITIRDAGFYVYGFDLTLAANVINDPGVFARIPSVPDAFKQILILEENVPQDEFFCDYRYFLNGEVISLTLEHLAGIIGIDYASVFAFRVDEPDAEPKGPCIKNYFKFDGTITDEKTNAVLTPKNAPSYVIGAVGQAVHFDSPSLQALSTSDIDPFDEVANPDGFTISAVIKKDPLSTARYLTISAKWRGANAPEEDQFHWFYDYILKKIFFAVRYTNGVYNFVSTEVIDITDFRRVSVTWSPVTKYLRLYVDDEVEATKIFENFDINLSTSQPFSIGAYDVSGIVPLTHSDGTIDELLFCCREYSNDDIFQIYNDGVILTLEDIEDQDPSGGDVNLPIALSDTTFDNTGTGLSSTNGQDVIEELKLLIDAIGSFIQLTFTQQFSFLGWTLNPSKGRYEYTILGTTHNLTDVGVVQVFRADPGLWVNCGDLNVEIDAITQDITIGVNDIPDGRFAGRINLVSMS